MTRTCSGHTEGRGGFLSAETAAAPGTPLGRTSSLFASLGNSEGAPPTHCPLTWGYRPPSSEVEAQQRSCRQRPSGPERNLPPPLLVQKAASLPLAWHVQEPNPDEVSKAPAGGRSTKPAAPQPWASLPSGRKDTNPELLQRLDLVGGQLAALPPQLCLCHWEGGRCSSPPPGTHAHPSKGRHPSEATSPPPPPRRRRLVESRKREAETPVLRGREF